MKSQNKIAFFLPDLGGGGAERVMVNLANGLSKRGFDIDFIVSKAIGPYFKEISNEINIISFNNTRIIFSIKNLWLYIIKKKPKCIISALSAANIIAIIASILCFKRVKVVIREANNIEEEICNEKKIKNKIIYKLKLIFYHFANIIIVNSKGSANAIEKNIKYISKNKIKILNNPVIDEKLINKSNFLVNHKWLCPKKHPVILGVGRLTIQKDFETLIKAYKIVRDKIQCKLIILGEGELRKKLYLLVEELGIKEDVDMPGFIDNPFNYMKNCDVFVLSSKYEGSPNVLIQAMAVGNRIVSTNCNSGPAELITSDEYGYLVPVGNVEEMANAIFNSILNGNEKLKRKDLKSYEIEEVIDNLLKIFEEKGLKFKEI